ncbi:MAG: hypothetical protein O2884_09695 [Chloroflexi bacterium]|nr:hypothetical protein [Chloroflexota bacterium]
MKKLSIGLLVALIAAAILTVPVLAKNHGTPPGAGGFGVVDGHLEGANPVAGRVCVDYENDGIEDVCEDMVRPDTTGMGLTIPKHFVATATFSAWAGPDLGDLAAAVDSLAGVACADVPIADAGMMLCQDPRTDVVKRVNVYWTANSANGARNTGAYDGTGR